MLSVMDESPDQISNPSTMHCAMERTSKLHGLAYSHECGIRPVALIARMPNSSACCWRAFTHSDQVVIWLLSSTMRLLRMYFVRTQGTSKSHERRLNKDKSLEVMPKRSERSLLARNTKRRFVMRSGRYNSAPTTRVLLWRCNWIHDDAVSLFVFCDATARSEGVSSARSLSLLLFSDLECTAICLWKGIKKGPAALTKVPGLIFNTGNQWTLELY
jgi:hypothetical protein